jgi:hypothetical protein
MSKTPNVIYRTRYYGPGSRKRNYYSSKDSSSDYLKYVDTGVKSGKYQDYMDYAGNREKSSGVFSRNGLLTMDEKKVMREKLSTTESVIWDSLITFEERYGKEKMKSWRSAKELIEKEFPKLLKDNNMSYENILWYAGLHENTDNRHIHLSFFEKEPRTFDYKKQKMRYHQGMISNDSINDFKLRIEKRMDGNEYSLHKFRDQILEQEENKFLKPDLTAIYDKDLKQMLLSLYRVLPKNKVGYESHELDEIRPQIDQITNYMLTHDDVSMSAYLELRRKLKKRDEETKEICLSHKTSPNGHLISDSFQKDLYRRCGNKILAYLRKVQERKGEFHKGTTEEERQRWDEKVRRGWLFKRTARLNEEVRKERESIYETFQWLLKKAEFERLVEEGVIEAE